MFKFSQNVVFFNIGPNCNTTKTASWFWEGRGNCNTLLKAGVVIFRDTKAIQLLEADGAASFHGGRLNKWQAFRATSSLLLVSGVDKGDGDGLRQEGGPGWRPGLPGNSFLGQYHGQEAWIGPPTEEIHLIKTWWTLQTPLHHCNLSILWQWGRYSPANDKTVSEFRYPCGTVVNTKHFSTCYCFLNDILDNLTINNIISH